MSPAAITPKQDRAALGISMMLLAYLCFSFIDTGVKWLVLAGIPALQLAFVRYAGHFALSLSLLLRDGVSVRGFATPKLGLVLLRSLLLAVSTMLNFLALRYLPLTLTSTILFLAPIIVCALSWPLLGERVGKFRLTAILIGFVGILIAIRPFGVDFHWATVLSLGAAASFALYTMLTRSLSGVVSSGIMQFYSGFVGTVLLLPVAVMVWRSPVDGIDWLILLSTGFFGWLGHEVLTRAFHYAPASMLTPFGYSFMLYLTAWSWLVFGTLPDRWTVVGAVIVAAAGLIIWGRELYLSRRLTPVPPAPGA